MNEQVEDCLSGAIAGAVLGATAGYLFLTDRGRRLRDELEPAIDDASDELTRFQGTVLRAAAVMTDGMRLVQEFAGPRSPYLVTSPLSHKIQ